MTNNSVNLRMIVLDILLELDKSDTMSHIVIRNALAKYQYLEKNERSFITKLAQGTIEKRIEEDYIIDQFSKTPVKKMKPVIRHIMEMSVYQLKYMDNVPASAVCNEAVKLAGKKKFVNLKGFVNGVLRNVSRNLDNITYPDKKSDIEKYISIKYSCPEWLIQLWNKKYSYDIIKQMLEGMDSDKKTYIRCNTNLVSPEELKVKLEKDGITVKCVNGLEYAFEISNYDYIADIESFNAGEFQIQDISSMLAGEAAKPANDDVIIDVCAAPGGKSINVALKAPKAHIEARDLTDYKVSMIEDNIDRLEIDNITAKVWDATKEDAGAVNTADIVIADLPCSGYGIIGRKPDIKYNSSIESAESLAKLQRQILSVVYKYVKKDGYLIYSTCTINPEENENNVKWFCEQYGFEDCTKEVIDYNEAFSMINETAEYGVQLLPGVNNTDGFYIARLKRMC